MKKLLPWVFLGIILRLVLIPAYFHPDIRGFNLAGYLISQTGRVFTFYDYVSSLPRTHQLVQIYRDDIFIYPPLAYFTPALFMKLLAPLYPWPVFHQLIYDFDSALADPAIFKLAYLLKGHYLIADLLCLLLIRKVVEDKYRFIASLAWLFNPVTLYATYLISQFDIYICLLLLLSLLFSQRGFSGFSSIALGVAAAFKPFPLFFLPFVNRNSSILSRLVSISVGVIAYALILTPFLSSPAFKHHALLADHSQKLMYAKISVSQTVYVSLFLAGLALLIWMNLNSHRMLPLWGWFGAVPLLFYSFSHFHPQWFMWGMPFLIISFAVLPGTRLTVSVLVAAFFLMVLTFEPSLNSNIFRLNFSFANFLNRYGLADTFLSGVKSLFFGTSVYLLYQWKKESQ